MCSPTPKLCPLPWCLAVVALAFTLGCSKPPTITSFTANPSAIYLGQITTLSWTATDATSFTVSGYSGTIGEGATSVTVSPTEDTTYTLTATGPGGSATSEPVTVTLVPRFDVTVGTYNGGNTGVTVAIVMRGSVGELITADTVVTVTPPAIASPNTPFNINCPGGRALCLASFPSLLAVTGTYTARTTLGGITAAKNAVLRSEVRLPTAGPVTVTQTGPSALEASWKSVTGAFSYHVVPVNLSKGGEAAGPDQILTGTSASLTTFTPIAAADRYGVVVEASVLDLTMATVPAALPAPNISRAMGQLGGTPNGWQLFPPSAYAGNTLTVSFTDLDVSERLAVIVMNIGGADGTGSSGVPAQLSVTGTAVLPLRVPEIDLLPVPPEPELRMDLAAHALERQIEAEVVERIRQGTPLAPVEQIAPAALPTTTNFCVRQGTSTLFQRRNATLKRESAHAAFYVDNGDLAHYGSYEPGIWDSLETAWETKIYPGDTSTFGAEGDVDSNGKLIILLSSTLGPATGGGILLGYYSANDVASPRDATSNCGGTRSNHADMFYLNGINNLVPGYNATDVINRIYPDTLAHEFQHLINFNQHCVVRPCPETEDVWINEGLSMVAEEIGGFGWNVSSGRTSGSRYLDRNRTSAGIESYDRRSLTYWQSDPIGNYEGAHAFFRYFADRMGPGVLSQLVQTSLSGLPNLENALGMSFSDAYAHWTTALMFSNEGMLGGSSSLFDFKGEGWTPLHTKLRHLNYVPLNSGGVTASLRTDGWNAFMTGNALGGAASITVTSTQTVKPHVVVVRFSGFLPQL
jgi:hypothetical protein